MPNCWGPPPIRIPEPLTAKSGLTRTAIRGVMPRLSPASTVLRSSVGDSTSRITSAATAWRISAGALPGPAKLTRAAGSPESSAVLSSRADATSIRSTRRARWSTTAGIGLAFMA